ncbi:MAG: hypothetical protein AAGM84_05755 [Pseudomonadota bacterium]
MSDRKAVVWCEDQGDLAFLNDEDAQRPLGDFFDVGDLLRFDLDVDRSYRLARNAELVQEAVGLKAVQNVREAASAHRCGTNCGADIIPFRINSLRSRQQDRPICATRKA